MKRILVSILKVLYWIVVPFALLFIAFSVHWAYFLDSTNPYDRFQARMVLIMSVTGLSFLTILRFKRQWLSGGVVVLHAAIFAIAVLATVFDDRVVPTLSGEPRFVISTVAGGVPPPTPISALSASFSLINGVATDAGGNLYFTAVHCIFKLDRQGMLTRVGGIGRPGESGDGGSALLAQMWTNSGLAVDSIGDIYLSGGSRIRKISTKGVITTVVGNSTAGYTGDGEKAIGAELNAAEGIAFDTANNLYIADRGNNRVRKVSSDGNILTVAGNGTAGYSGDGGPATKAQLSSPSFVAVDRTGNLYITDSNNKCIRRVTPSGSIDTVVGSAARGAGAVELNSPTGIAIDDDGALFIADAGANHILRLNPDGNVVRVAGLFSGGYSGGYSGDGGSATEARITSPQGLAVDHGGNLYFADSLNDRIREVSHSGVIATVAGNGSKGYSGDNGPAAQAQLFDPDAVVIDNAGSVVVADAGNARVRRISRGGLITTVAGTGKVGYSGDGGPAINAELGGRQPIVGLGLAVDDDGTIYIADWGNDRVRKVTNGIITTVAGNGRTGYSGDGGPATNAELNPSGIALDRRGNLYISDMAHHVVRKVTAAGIITTAAGNGRQGNLGDGGPAVEAQLNSPISVAVDAGGALYIADQASSVIRRVTADGIIITIAGNGTQGYSGDGRRATNASLYISGAIALDSSGNLYVAEVGRIRKITANHMITTVGGVGACRCYTGDNGPAIKAGLWVPKGLALDREGDIYFSDSPDHAVRMLRK